MPVRSARLLWVLLIVYTLLVLIDVASTMAAFSTATNSHVPMWHWEWNPATATVMRVYGNTGWLLYEGVCIAVPWVLLPFMWRAQRDWSMAEAPRAQAFIRLLVIGPLVVLCLWRTGASAFNIAQAAMAPLGNSPPSGPVVGGATETATTVATIAASPSPSVAASPTSRPHPNPTATPVPVQPTATPTPSLTISPTPPGPVNACQGQDATFSVTYMGSASPATITVMSSSSSRFTVSLDNSTFGGFESGQIASGSTATVWVRAPFNSGKTASIYVTVTGFGTKTLQATNNGCGG